MSCPDEHERSVRRDGDKTYSYCAARDQHEGSHAMTDLERTYETPDGMVVPWRVSYIIELQTPDQIAALPDGTVLRSISGETAVKGRDPIDLDTRFGRTAWGLPDRRDLIRARWLAR